QPHLGVVHLAVLLVPQVLEQGLPNVRPVGARVQRRQEPREGGLEGVVLARVFLELGTGELSGPPLRVERVLQQVALSDERVDSLEKIHAAWGPPSSDGDSSAEPPGAKDSPPSR